MQQSSAATLSQTQPSSQPQPAVSNLSTAPAVGDSTAATTSAPSRPDVVLIQAGLWARFWLFIVISHALLEYHTFADGICLCYVSTVVFLIRHAKLWIGLVFAYFSVYGYRKLIYFGVFAIAETGLGLILGLL
ncbi:uncharacterized protein BJ212DRAFT_184394 [Suillus subaureus]|uniref:Uncharacterized protein n=1 Tax=Suillus subaureus TaxID=48587 RepID=A0A9P7EB71_9AGAM|nr:uncharacterized protein BJ212DRAFT_184394 [Suillus subaureus]KAG1816315.1 hypothetical protein BJ212DRAFT_184394 [Suillus subaureus]